MAKLLQQTLDEESAADEKLTNIAVTTVNPSAAVTGTRGAATVKVSVPVLGAQRDHKDVERA